MTPKFVKQTSQWLHSSIKFANPVSTTATSPQQPPLYNGHLSTTATSPQRPPLYNGHLSTTPLYDGHLSTTATSLRQPFFLVDCPHIDSCLKLSMTVTFFCPQGGRCKEVQLYSQSSSNAFKGKKTWQRERINKCMTTKNMYIFFAHCLEQGHKFTSFCLEQVQSLKDQPHSKFKGVVQPTCMQG